MKLLLLNIFLLPSLLFAGPTKVGNSDDGTDLESFTLMKSGKLIESQKKATMLVKKLNLAGIPGLGNLIPEIESNKVYLTMKNISAKRLEELGAYHSGMDRYVYARTFARTHSPTRFFPVALNLSEKQLIALHIHEALHRALPKHIREDEKIATEITLAITSPNASFDRVKETCDKYLNPIEIQARKFLPRRGAGPTTMSLHYYKYTDPSGKRQNIFNPLDEMYSLRSKAYPFHNNWSTLGFGLNFSFFKADKDSYMGPLEMSVGMILWTIKGFDFDLNVGWARDTGSSKEFRNSLSARDSFRVSGNLIKNYNDGLSVEHGVAYVKSANSRKTFSGVNYVYHYGSVTTAKMSVLKRVDRWQFGSDLRVILTGDFQVQGGTVDISTTRNTILAIGPIIKWKRKRLELSVLSNIILTNSQDTDFSALGDVLGQGLGQGHFGLGLKYFF